VLQYLEQAPHFSRPQFYTRPYSEHTTARAQYAFVPAAGMTLFNNMPELLKNFRTLRTTVCRPSTGCRTTPRGCRAAQQTMTPALNRGMEKALADFDQVFKGQAMPTLDQLFSRLPKALLMRILDAAKHEGVTFTFASADEGLTPARTPGLVQRTGVPAKAQARTGLDKTDGGSQIAQSARTSG
jgi:hypothetical protein